MKAAVVSSDLTIDKSRSSVSKVIPLLEGLQTHYDFAKFVLTTATFSNPFFPVVYQRHRKNYQGGTNRQVLLTWKNMNWS